MSPGVNKLPQCFSVDVKAPVEGRDKSADLGDSPQHFSFAGLNAPFGKSDDCCAELQDKLHLLALSGEDKLADPPSVVPPD